MKNFLVPLAVGVAILGCVLAVSANVTSSKMYQTLDQERYKRLAAEEQLQKARGKIAGLEQELTAAMDKINNIESIIQKGTSTNQEMDLKLQALTQEKQALEETIKQLQGQIPVIPSDVGAMETP